MHIVVGRRRHAHGARLRQPLQSGGDIYPISEQITAPDHRLTDMHPNPEHDPTFLGNRFVDGGHPLLNGKGALDGIYGTREFCQDAVPCGVGDTTTMLLDLTIRDLAVGCE